MDFWGPFAPTFNTQYRYVIGFIDIFSRHVTVYLTRTRDTAPELVERYIADMRAVRVAVRRLHFDNAREFTSERMQGISRAHAFQITTSCEYDHNQNGLIERTWQTLQASCRAMLLGVRTPKLPMTSTSPTWSSVCVPGLPYWAVRRSKPSARSQSRLGGDRRQNTCARKMSRGDQSSG